ncbi:BnaCnng37880D [Brassica napus]|uniref:BnaCnng37880D protein n=1 Tax=Brassica napus TaxID=3708 RepID=A0A078J953_BRANA|nr:BnaCnng37880D [Brassica napus]
MKFAIGDPLTRFRKFSFALC